MSEQGHDKQALTRRESLVRFGGLAATIAGAGWAGERLLAPEAADAATTGPAAVSSGLVTCVLTAEMTEGPYYVPGATAASARFSCCGAAEPATWGV